VLSEQIEGNERPRTSKQLERSDLVELQQSLEKGTLSSETKCNTPADLISAG
jgi:hypothetical protein